MSDTKKCDIVTPNSANQIGAISFSPEAHAAAEALTQNMDCATFYWPVDNLANLTGSREEMLRAYRHVRDDIRNKLSIYFGKPIAGNT